MAYGAGIPTHRAGRRLDVVLGPRTVVMQHGGHVSVHNGTHCAALGCKSKACGRLEEVMGSADLDHSPVTWSSAKVPVDDTCIPTLGFTRDPGKWDLAVRELAAAGLEVVAVELDKRVDDGLWISMPRAESRRCLQSVALVWRMMLTLTAAAADLAFCRGLVADRRHKAPARIARSFRDLCQASEWHSHANRASASNAAAQLEEARRNFRKAQRSEAKQARAEKLAELNDALE